MKMIKLKKLLSEQLLNESSTLSNIGATPAQVNAVHNSNNINLLKYDNEYEQVKTKAIAKKMLIDNNVHDVVIVSFDREGNISVITRIDNVSYDIVSYDVNGNRISTNTKALTANNAIRELGKAVKIYYTTRGAYDTSRTGRELKKSSKDIEFEVENAIKGIVEVAYTKIENHFNAVFKRIKEEATAAMMNDDYETAESLLDIISPRGSGFLGSGKRKPREIKDLINVPFNTWAKTAKQIMLERAKMAMQYKSDIQPKRYDIDFDINDLDIAMYKQTARQEMVKIYNEIFNKFNNIIKYHKK